MVSFHSNLAVEQGTMMEDGSWRIEKIVRSILHPLSSILPILLLFAVQNLAHAADENPLLTSWLKAQMNIQTWSADFEQTRTLKSFARPLTSTGHVWFAAPNRFHWELGNPAQTIAVRQPEQLLVIYPKLKRVEKYSLAGNLTGPWKDAMALLEAGFPRDKKELQNNFKIQSLVVTNEIVEIALQPKSASARKMMPQIKIAFGTNDFSLRATELQFADGSTLRNDFKNPKLNEKFDEVLF
ncbi:MAG: outer membrane lipoprotein carrier protein LolA, partial [Limisphaerales bacterium]